MTEYEDIEQRAVEKTRKQKLKMKVTGKSVFILDKAARKISKKS